MISPVAQPVPQGDYVAAKRHGTLIFTAGMTPRRKGVLLFKGPVRAAEPVANYEDAVILATSNALAAARGLLAEDEAIGGIAAMTVYILAEAGFTAHSALADYASRFLREELGDAGICARAAVGVMSLPQNAPVEVQIVAGVAPLLS